MKLIDWLTQNEISAAAFGRMVELSRSGANRIVKGERVPRPVTMRRIFKVTNGAVTPSDFVATEVRQ